MRAYHGTRVDSKDNFWDLFLLPAGFQGENSIYQICASKCLYPPSCHLDLLRELLDLWHRVSRWEGSYMALLSFYKYEKSESIFFLSLVI